MSNWVCFLCLPFPRSGLLQRRQKWRDGLKAFCDRESNSLETYKTVPVWKREPVRVLSLFGDIRRGEWSEACRSFPGDGPENVP